MALYRLKIVNMLRVYTLELFFLNLKTEINELFVHTNNPFFEFNLCKYYHFTFKNIEYKLLIIHYLHPYFFDNFIIYYVISSVNVYNCFYLILIITLG